VSSELKLTSSELELTYGELELTSRKIVFVKTLVIVHGFYEKPMFPIN
jgi:hypothetical protein